jgi:hypothetical protein
MDLLETGFAHSGSICCSGEGDHEGRPYEKIVLVGASDPSPTGAGFRVKNPLWLPCRSEIKFRLSRTREHHCLTVNLGVN